jgi:20S proteasome alpha/beta subunit
VTLIVGLRCADGSVLMCADREQSDQVAKRSVDKIFRVRLNQGTVLVAGAGRSSIVDNALMRLERALQTADSQRGNVLLDTHRDVIETILYEIHEEYIWGRTDENERAIRVMVAASFISGGSAPFLYGTDSDVLYSHQLYGCAGIGQDLAYYFVDKLYHHHLSREVAVLLAAFIFREVSQSVEGVGLGADMILLAAKEQRIYSLPHQRAKELEAIVPDLADVIAKAWNKGVTVPEWLTEFLK